MSYHIYGIGKAIVDKEFAIDDAVFADVSMEKGTTTLIVENQLASMLSPLTERYSLKNVSAMAAPPRLRL